MWATSSHQARAKSLSMGIFKIESQGPCAVGDGASPPRVSHQRTAARHAHGQMLTIGRHVYLGVFARFRDDDRSRRCDCRTVSAPDLPLAGQGPFHQVGVPDAAGVYVDVEPILQVGQAAGAQIQGRKKHDASCAAVRSTRSRCTDKMAALTRLVASSSVSAVSTPRGSGTGDSAVPWFIGCTVTLLPPSIRRPAEVYIKSRGRPRISLSLPTGSSRSG